MRDMSVTGGV